jgi:hypothetical protein
MLRPVSFRGSLWPCLIACVVLLIWAVSVRADSLRLLTDLEYEITNSTTTEKATDLRYETERSVFSQLYSLEIQKELMPNLKLNFGGLFDQDDSNSTTSDPQGQDNDMKNTAFRPYLDLQLSSPLLRATAGYRKNEIKRRASTSGTRRDFTEEYSAALSWDPVEWPEVDLDFTRNLAYNKPLTNDQQVDTYQLRSRYTYQDYRFIYSHTTSDARNNVTDFDTLTNSDNGTLRFSRSYWQDKVAVNSSLRASRQAIEFSGSGDRLVPTTSTGVIIGSTADPLPQTSDPDPGFSLEDVDLLVDSPLAADQFSFGLDFGAPTDVDRLFINLVDLANNSSADFIWEVYVRDNSSEEWSRVSAVQNSTNRAENRFELAFASLETRFIKIVTRPLAPPVVSAGENLLISNLVARRTLPADTSEFITTDWTGDMSVNWKHSVRTSTGYDFLYREQRSDPLDEKKTQLNTGVRLRHRFNHVFLGNMQLQRAESREQGEGPRTDYTYSAALAAKYLETFDQSLTYSYSHQRDENARTGTSNAVFLRSNLDLYQGWSLYLDNGYSWQDPAEGADTNTTFVRIGSNIVPNRWLNLTLNYGVSWSRETGRPVSRDQNGRLVIAWVPTSTLSLSADLAFTDETGDVKDSTVDQRYFINWSPFRDGTLLFSLAYGHSNESDDEKTWTLSPTLRWQVNRKTQMTLEYALGERQDLTESVEFENISLALRVFY